MAQSGAYFGKGRGPIVIEGAQCSGSEESLHRCFQTRSQFCSHHNDAGVQCSGLRTRTDIKIIMNTPKGWIGWLLCNTLCLAYKLYGIARDLVLIFDMKPAYWAWVVHSDTGSDIIYFCLYQQNKILLLLENYVKCLVKISKCILDQNSMPLVDLNILSYNLCLWSVQVHLLHQHSFVSTCYNSDSTFMIF